MSVIRPDLLVGECVFFEPENCYCDDVNPCQRCVNEARKLEGVRVEDAHGRQWTIREASTKDAMVTVDGGGIEPYWAPVYDLIRAPAVEPDVLHPLAELHRYLFPERYDAVEAYQWHAGTIEEVAAMIERLAAGNGVEVATPS